MNKIHLAKTVGFHYQIERSEFQFPAGEIKKRVWINGV